MSLKFRRVTSLKDYKIKMGVWLTVTLMSCSSAVYQALPKEIENNSGLEEVYKDLTSRDYSETSADIISATDSKATSKSASPDSRNQVTYDYEDTSGTESSTVSFEEVENQQTTDTSSNQVSLQVDAESQVNTLQDNYTPTGNIVQNNQQATTVTSIQQLTQSTVQQPTGEQTVNQPTIEQTVQQPTQQVKQVTQQANKQSVNKVESWEDDMFDTDPFQQSTSKSSSNEKSVTPQKKQTSNNSIIHPQASSVVKNDSKSTKKKEGLTKPSGNTTLSDFWSEVSNATDESELLVPIDKSLQDKIAKELGDIDKVNSSNKLTDHVPLVENTKDDKFFIDARTMEYNTKDEAIIYQPKGVSSDEALQTLNINLAKRNVSLQKIKLTNQFASDALQSSKTNAYNMYTKLKANQDDTYKVSYDSKTNVIYFSILNASINETIDIIESIGNISEFRNYSENSSTQLENYSLEENENIITFLVTVVQGYNGNLQVILDGIPYVFLIDISEEPLLSDSAKATYLKLIKPDPITVMNPHHTHGGESSDNIESDNSHSQGKGTSSSDYTHDSGYDPYKDVDEPEYINPYKDADTYNSPTDYNPYKESGWGKTDESTVLENNIVDGSVVKDYDGMVLGSVDTNGNSVDLAQETRDTKPAALVKYAPLELETEPLPNHIPYTVIPCIILTIIGLIMYLYYLQLYTKEYKAYLETQGLIGGHISHSEFVDYTKLDGEDIVFGESENTEEQSIESNFKGTASDL